MPLSPTPPTVTATHTPPSPTMTSAEINAWLNTVPNGSLINLHEVVIDAEEGPIIVADRHDLLFLGGSVTQCTDGTNVSPKTWYPRLHLNWPRNRCGWLIVNSSRCAWHASGFEGTNASAAYKGQSYEEQAAFSIRRSSDIEISGAGISDAWGDAVTMVHDDNDSTRSPCERVWLNGLHINNVGRNFVSLVCGTDITITNITADRSGRSAFNVEPAVEANRIERVEVSNIAASRVTGALIANKGASNQVHDITWRDMRLADKPVLISIEGRLDRPGRRTNYVIERISGGGASIANGVPVNISNVDNLIVRDIWQRTAGYLADGTGKVIYPGVGMRLAGINTGRVERTEFPKGKSAAPTGDVTPVTYAGCTNITAV